MKDNMSVSNGPGELTIFCKSQLKIVIKCHKWNAASVFLYKQFYK